MKVPCPEDLLWRRQALFLLLLAFVLGLPVTSSHWLEPISFRSYSGWGREQHVTSSRGQKPSPNDLKVHRPRKTPPLHPLDINRATRKELVTLPGIGPVLAERIVIYRKEKGPFTDVSELKEVRGIGEKRYERIERWIQAGREEK